jgi:chemotaxis methyl-accepting protein methylase
VPGLVYTVFIGGIEYCVEAVHVAGTFAIERIAPVHGASADVLGLHNWKGAPLPVLDPRPHLGLPRHGDAANRGTALVVRQSGAQVAIAVDSVAGPLPDSGAERRILDPRSLFGGHAAAPARDTLAGVRDALWKLASFEVSDMNSAWVHRRCRSAKWGGALPSTEKGAADFLAGFASPCIDMLWNESLHAALSGLLPGPSTRHFAIWNHRCGRGNDALSLACILAMDRPRLKVKIWAVDELAPIVEAQSSSWSAESVPEYLATSGLLDEEGGRFSGGAAVRARIILVCADAFEPVPESFDMIVCRDRLSYLGTDARAALITAFRRALRPEGILIIGAHEKLPSSDWIEGSGARLSSWTMRGISARAPAPRGRREVLS